MDTYTNPSPQQRSTPLPPALRPPCPPSPELQWLEQR
uniref:Uncharacterized protein n=1 Tax=Anguilla anguilla TaxID=7936 RepID=A0A0E9SZR3_ANGAN